MKTCRSEEGELDQRKKNKLLINKLHYANVLKPLSDCIALIYCSTICPKISSAALLMVNFVSQILQDTWLFLSGNLKDRLPFAF